MLDIRRLRALQEVARVGSFSAAARSLDYSQPAISHHIKRLEEEAGAALVTRFSRGVELTEAGRLLVEHAEGIFALMATAENELAAITGLTAGQVRVVAFPSAGTTLVPAALAWMAEHHPAIEVSLVSAIPPESLALLCEGECDLVLSFDYPGTATAETAVLLKIPLLVGRLHAVLPRGHALDGEGELDLGALRGERWIAGCARCHRGLVDACAAVGFAPETTFGVSDLNAIQSMVAAGLGVALVPALVLATFQHPQVVVRELANAPTWEVCAVIADDPSPAILAVLEALRAATGELASPLDRAAALDHPRALSGAAASRE